MRDKLIDLITVGIARYHVKKANNENPDMAAIIADVLIENDYRKASDVAEEIFAEIDRLFKRHRIEFDMSCIDIDFDKGLAELKRNTRRN